MTKVKMTVRLKGGAGSGHHGHSGRPGKRGGSTGGSGGSAFPSTPKGWSKRNFGTTSKGFVKRRTSGFGTTEVAVTLHSTNQWTVMRRSARPHGMFMLGDVARGKDRLHFTKFQEAFEYAEDVLAGKQERRHASKGF